MEKIDNAAKARGSAASKVKRLDRLALFSDQTAGFLTPAEAKPHSDVRVRLRTGKNNADDCYLVAGKERIRMKKSGRSDPFFDYYTAGLHLTDSPVLYAFELVTGSLHLFYTRRGVTETFEQGDAFCLVPGFQVPRWAEGAVMYQIFTDRFCNGDPSNDVLTGEYYLAGEQSRQVEDWDSMPEAYDVNRHYGGDLQGIIDKLDYLKDLGIEALYLNPIFLSPSNHKYDTQDYEHVDPHFGVLVRGAGPQTKVLPKGAKDNRRSPAYLERIMSPENLKASDRLLAELIGKAHERGIRVILDGVFNHCGSFHRWMDRERIYEFSGEKKPGAFLRQKSPYHDYFSFTRKFWPAHAEYESWWGFETLPKLNYEGSRELQEEILKIAVKWISPPYSADGWRLDVAADLGHSEEFNHSFWKQFRDAVKKARPDAVLIAEHYGDPAAWLQGDEWDTVMNYDRFMDPVSWFLTGMEKHSDVFDPSRRNDPELFWSAMTGEGMPVPEISLRCSMNQLSNHDHSRFLTRTNGRVGRLRMENGRPLSEEAETGISKPVFREAILIQMTWPGAPTVYYGDEAGLCGFTDPDNRRPYPWGKEDEALLNFTRKAIAVRRENSALRHGSLIRLADSGGFLSYGRFDRQQSIIVLINNEEDRVSCDVPVIYAGVPARAELELLLRTDIRGGFTPSQVKSFPVDKGILTVQMPARSGMILRWQKEQKKDPAPADDTAEDMK